ncbi:hypothetical protein [Yeosuana marina]|uniref:hypothetical protein n=1 Tax=Yeosuana marina TaxID=1565536 RepID=UPI0014216B90|nr:hypothetical protein [Yeosuana marina]|tara:strand:- start:407 stop:616 length:210 start_codon:yes stop_codon:yes gene_type:complete
MENLALKSLFIIPVLFIADYMVMLMVGSISHLLGFTTSFSSIGMVVILVSLVVFIMALTPEIKALIKKA